MIDGERCSHRTGGFMEQWNLMIAGPTAYRAPLRRPPTRTRKVAAGFTGLKSRSIAALKDDNAD